MKLNRAPVGFAVLRHRSALLAAPLIPFWDLWAFTLWLTALTGRTVHWRNTRLHLTPDGRIAPEPLE